MQDLYEAGKPIDLVTLVESSGVSGSILAEISQSFAVKSTFDHHLKIVKNNATKRSVIQLAKELISDANNSKTDADSLIEKAEQSLSDIREKRIDTKGYDTIKNTVLQIYNKIDDRMKNPGQLVGISTGYPDIDKKTGGLEKKKLYYIGARPSMGKTAIATQMPMLQPKGNCYSEMSNEQLTPS